MCFWKPLFTSRFLDGIRFLTVSIGEYPEIFQRDAMLSSNHCCRIQRADRSLLMGEMRGSCSVAVMRDGPYPLRNVLLICPFAARSRC
jgi:hypothetical protein